MQYISTHTSIPVPAVLDFWNPRDDSGAILMEWFPDTRTVGEAWPMLSEEQKSIITNQIRGYVDQLRELKQPLHKHGQICAIDGTAFWDTRIKLDRPVGPFSSEETFNNYRLSLLDRYRQSKISSMKVKALESNLHIDHQVVFTHGDLNERNILIDNNCKVVAILDWETAAWMPEYWEHVKAMGNGRIKDWSKYAIDFAPAFPQELEIDNEFLIINGFAPF